MWVFGSRNLWFSHFVLFFTNSTLGYVCVYGLQWNYCGNEEENNMIYDVLIVSLVKFPWGQTGPSEGGGGAVCYGWKEGVK